MTFWGYKDKSDPGQNKSASHHTNHSPRARVMGARELRFGMFCSPTPSPENTDRVGCSPENAKGHQDHHNDGKANEELDGPFLHISHPNKLDVPPQIWSSYIF